MSVPASQVPFRFENTSERTKKNLVLFKFDVDEGFNQRLSALVLQKERELVARLEPSPVAGISYGLTPLWRQFNVLSWRTPECDELGRMIASAVRVYAEEYGVRELPRHIQCWANVLRKGQAFALHAHSGPRDIAGVYYPDVGDSGKQSQGLTYYMIGTGEPKGEIIDADFVEVSPQDGQLNVFQSDLHHFVSTYDSDTPRISIAWDLCHEPKAGFTFIPFAI